MNNKELILKQYLDFNGEEAKKIVEMKLPDVLHGVRLGKKAVRIDYLKTVENELRYYYHWFAQEGHEGELNKALERGYMEDLDLIKNLTNNIGLFYINEIDGLLLLGNDKKIKISKRGII